MVTYLACARGIATAATNDESHSSWMDFTWSYLTTLPEPRGTRRTDAKRPRGISWNYAADREKVAGYVTPTGGHP